MIINLFISIAIFIVSSYYWIINLSSQNLGLKSAESKLSNALTNVPFLSEVSLFLIGVLLSIILLGIIAHIISKNLEVLFHRSLSYFTCLVITWCLLFLSIMGLSSNLYPNLLFSHSSWDNTLLLIITISVLFLLLLSSVLTKKNTKLISAILLILVIPELTNINLTKFNDYEAKPNIFIVGIDSLNVDEINITRTPFLEKFIKKSNHLPNTYTHIARTFPSWVTVLTGKHPITNKARLNLTNFNNINLEETLPYYLKNEGYKNYYIQDERRFNNIDERFYFDHVIGPPATAAEFLLSKVIDFPLVTLLSELKFFQLFIPHIQNNRAAWATYRPERFSKEIENNLASSKHPIFSAAHFTLPHWPYKVNGQIVDNGTNYKKYLKTLTLVDKQIQNYFAILERKNLLKNAIVFMISDHGESFARRSDVPINSNSEIINLAGHGTTIISGSQYKVLLSFEYIKDEISIDFKSINPSLNFALSDVTPTIIDLLNLNITTKFDGMSILKVDKQRSIPLESSLQPMFNSKGTIDLNGTIKKNSHLFEVNSLGKVVVKKKVYRDAVASKQRGIIFDKWQISHYPEYDSKIYITDLNKNLLYDINSFSDNNLKNKLIKDLCSHFESDIIITIISQCINLNYAKSNSKKVL